MEAPSSNQNLPPLLVLADGDPDDQEFFCNSLLRLHPQVRVNIFANGKELLEYLGTLPEEILPTCFVLGYKMMDLPAPQVLQAISFMQRYKDVPKIVWSNLVAEDQANECLALGALRFVMKPASFEEFDKFIESLSPFFAVAETGDSNTDAETLAG